MVDVPLSHTVVVATVRMDQPEVQTQLDGYRGLLTDDERTRERRFRRRADRDRFVVARATARLLLSRFGPLEPDAWRFEMNGHGRPEIANLPAGAETLRFNISHTNGLVACAVTGDREVGVDVELVDRRLTTDVAGRFFAPREVADLRAHPADRQPRVFFDYWTLKEAYIKARGLGLALPLRHFAFSLRPPHGPTIAFDAELPDDADTWQFAQAWPTGQHRLGLAIRRSGADLRVQYEDIVPQVSR